MIIHCTTIAALGRDKPLRYLIRDYFSLPKTTALMPALLARRLGQADLVLCLLRLRDGHPALRESAEGYITRLVGHPILYGPPCLLHYRSNGAPSVGADRSPRISWVNPTNPRLPRTEAFLRWPEYRVGRTESQLRSRGVTRRDFRRAIRRGWIKLEEKAAS
jgi:hypothetical protein